MKPWSHAWLIAAGAYPGFCSMKRLGAFLLPLDGMLVHRRSLPRNLLGFPQQFAGTHLFTWVERGTVRVKCLAQEHNTMSRARTRNRSARSGVGRTNHEASAPPIMLLTNPKKGGTQQQTSTFFKSSTASGYAQWAQWSTCSKACRYLGVEGTRRRRRICEIRELGCDGPAEEVRECNTEDCQGRYLHSQN